MQHNHMVTYEVNICVANIIIDDYLAWLIPHMRDMLQFKGFQLAQYYKELCTEDKDTVTLIAQYQVESLDDFNHYFEHHAPLMRQEAIDKFGNQVSFTRRILQKQQEYFVS